MRRSLQQLLAVFVLLGAIAWWITGRVDLSRSLQEFFLGEPEAAFAPEATGEQQEKILLEKALAELPDPPSNHSPEVAGLLPRLKELQTIPEMVIRAVQRDRDTPEGQVPSPWGEAEVEALRNYQAKFREAWEPFLSGPAPDWAKFPDSAIFFRSRFPILSPLYEDLFHYGFYQPGEPASWAMEWESRSEFYLRFLRQCTTLGTLRFGTLGPWAVTDTVFGAEFSEKTIREADYFFSPQSQNPEELLPLTPPTATVETLRQGLKTDQAVFLRTAEYLESLPPLTPAKFGLTRLLADESDANWFVTHVDRPKTSRDLAALLRQGAEQIGSLSQKTYLSGPAWRQWLSGDLDKGWNPALRESLKGMQEFEQTTMQYRVALAFLQASAGYRRSGLEGMRNIPDPARPGSFLTVTDSTNGITLSSVFQTKEGENYSFTFKAPSNP